MSDLAKQTENHQKRAFTAFINTTLENYSTPEVFENYKLESGDDLRDGVTDGMLMFYFIQALQVKNGASSLDEADISVKINKKKLKEHTSKLFEKINNLQILFDYLVKTHQITLVNITTHNIAKGEEGWKAILGFVWTIIFEFHIQKKGKFVVETMTEEMKQRRAAVIEKQNPDAIEQIEALEEVEAIHSDLKAWLKQRDLTADFSNDYWKSGEALHNLIKDLIKDRPLESDYEEVMNNVSDEDREEAAKYAQVAIDFAESNLKVPAIVTGEDVAAGADAMSMQTYVSCYRDSSLSLYKQQLAPEIIDIQNQLNQSVNFDDDEEENVVAEEEETAEEVVEDEPVEEEEETVEEEVETAVVEEEEVVTKEEKVTPQNNNDSLTPIARFRQQQYARNEAKEKTLRESREKMKEEAAAFRSKFSDERDHRITMALKRNKDEESLFQEQLEAESTKENEDWAKVVQYILPSKNPDTGRMKSMFHSLKKTPPVEKMSMFKGPAAFKNASE
mmetsp:Transcript_4898/g.7253  ORF Transcript_4898/g.7253 Transcript_4898/m.7253 type:complete len:505 (+) Transcript_4898:19-1533(+)